MSRQTFGQFIGIEADPRSRLGSELFALPSCYIGVELEYEKFPMCEDFSAGLHWWKVTQDGSLRGDNSYELVLSHPLCGKDLEDALHQVCDPIKDGTQRPPDLGIRCSTHIHIDVRDMLPEEITRMLSIVCTVEPILFNYVGDKRSENIYCLPMSSSNALRDKIGQGLPLRRFDNYSRNKYLSAMCNKHEKYTALNLKVATGIGSMEFRHMVALDQFQNIVDWINIIMCIKKYAMEQTFSVETFPEFFSNLGPQQFILDIFGEYAPRLMKHSGDVDIVGELYNGIRATQDMVYRHALNLANLEILYNLCKENEVISSWWKDNDHFKSPDFLRDWGKSISYSVKNCSPIPGHNAEHLLMVMDSFSDYRSKVLGKEVDFGGEPKKKNRFSLGDIDYQADELEGFDEDNDEAEPDPEEDNF